MLEALWHVTDQLKEDEVMFVSVSLRYRVHRVPCWRTLHSMLIVSKPSKGKVWEMALHWLATQLWRHRVARPDLRDDLSAHHYKYSLAAAFKIVRGCNFPLYPSVFSYSAAYMFTVPRIFCNLRSSVFEISTMSRVHKFQLSFPEETILNYIIFNYFAKSVYFLFKVLMIGPRVGVRYQWRIKRDYLPMPSKDLITHTKTTEEIILSLPVHRIKRMPIFILYWGQWHVPLPLFSSKYTRRETALSKICWSSS